MNYTQCPQCGAGFGRPLSDCCPECGVELFESDPDEKPVPVVVTSAAEALNAATGALLGPHCWHLNCSACGAAVETPQGYLVWDRVVIVAEPQAGELVGRRWFEELPKTAACRNGHMVAVPERFPGDDERLTPPVTCRLSWQELLEPGEPNGEPLGLTGECQVTIEDDDFVSPPELEFWFPLSGAPDTFDDQLDAALAVRNCRRVSDVRSWPSADGAEGECEIVSCLPDHEGE